MDGKGRAAQGGMTDQANNKIRECLPVAGKEKSRLQWGPVFVHRAASRLAVLWLNGAVVLAGDEGGSSRGGGVSSSSR